MLSMRYLHHRHTATTPDEVNASRGGSRVNRHPWVMSSRRANIHKEQNTDTSTSHTHTHRHIEGTPADALDHGGSFQRQSPCDDVHIRGQPHGQEHLRAEHATVPHLRPFALAGGGGGGGAQVYV